MDNTELKDIVPGLTSKLKEIGDSIDSIKTIAESDRDKDIKLVLDRVLHERIVHLLKSTGDIAILSEEDESGSDFSSYEGFQWIIDPLDGSLNHYRGMPLCCISVALWRGREPVMGIIYDFNRGEMFTGVVGKGASLNGMPVSVSGVSEKNQAVLCTGFPSYRDYEQASLMKFISFVQSWKKVRLLGSAALSLAYVAAGRADGYIEEDIRIWDVAAGLALVKAAGGEIFYNYGGRINFVTAGATNGKIPVREVTP